ncbi:hypothetical protein M427DRAFT_148615 [Gonapodya prolifera JEL478]|uniref:Major facilitator superfamily (MFS) profile domain-containing protein n=1 Tax=Gonapodya prolifera (strain JEL478) TaxID=1344416 RepID=A0A139A150_GONPJ|nr:hypothetical protein M427DRAFT_148615 [Gonapodya prolifera JEL478]|eukprot:KXS10510.1 hypothetical protein M427DRAFT_148615 [Gonapodya prolifera JEL478]
MTLMEPNAHTTSALLPTAPPAESVHQKMQIQAIDAKESELVLASLSPSHSDRTDASSARSTSFSRRRYWIIQGLVMRMATAASLSNSIFLPSLPVRCVIPVICCCLFGLPIPPSHQTQQIDLGTFQQAINASISIATFMNALAPLLWAQLADAQAQALISDIKLSHSPRSPHHIHPFDPHRDRRDRAGLLLDKHCNVLHHEDLAADWNERGAFRGEHECSLVAAVDDSWGTLSDINPSSSRSQALRFFYIGYQGANTIAPALGGVISDSLGWRWSFIVAAIYQLNSPSPLSPFPPPSPAHHGTLALDGTAALS